jgi:hypothetical protein
MAVCWAKRASHGIVTTSAVRFANLPNRRVRTQLRVGTRWFRAGPPGAATTIIVADALRIATTAAEIFGFGFIALLPEG